MANDRIAEVVRLPLRSREVEVAIERHETYSYCGRQPKVALHCKVAAPGPDFGKDIVGYYRLDRFDKRRRCYAPDKSKIVRDLGRLLPDYVHKKGQPLPLGRIMNKTAIAKTEWVTKDAAGEPLAPQQCYEKIKCFKL
jgi:hypothetical protein